MSNKSLLQGYPNCNEKLPVDTPKETYYFYQFMPIEKETQINAGRGIKKVGIPIEIANPEYIRAIYTRFGTSAPSVLSQLRSKVDTFESAWENTVVNPPPAIDELHIDNVPQVLASGIISSNNTDFDISNLQEVKHQIATGDPFVTTLTSGNLTKTFRIVPKLSKLCDVPERMMIDKSAVSDLLSKKTIHIQGSGTVNLEINASAATSLLKDGFAKINVKIPGVSAKKSLLLELPKSEENIDVKPLRSGPAPSRYTHDTQPMEAPWLNPEFVVYVPIIQTWEATGYERGAMINTFSLAPQEQITVEIFSWDRRKVSSEFSTSRESESSIENSFSQKITNEVLNEAKNTNGWEFGANAGFTVPQIALNVGANFKISDKNEITQKNTLQDITEAVSKAAFKIKSSIQTKVTESQEFGKEERITRKFQNPNTGRILHLDCFEVLGSYEVLTKYDFENAKLCLLLPCIDFLKQLENPSTEVRASFLLQLEGILYDQVPVRLQSGFDSARLVLAWNRICKYACDSECDCTKPTTSGSAGQGAADAGNPYAAELSVAMDDMLKAIQNVRDASGLPLSKSLGIPAELPGYLDRTDEEKAALRRGFHAYLFKKLVLESIASTFWNACIDFSKAPSEIAAGKIVQNASVQVINVLNGALAYASVGVTAIRQLLESVKEFGFNTPFMLLYLGFDDYGLENAFRNLKSKYDAWNKIEEERKHPPAPEKDPNAANNDKPKRRTDDANYSAESLATASVNIDALVNYININRSMYRTLIWNSLHPSDRIRYLSQYGELSKYTTPRVLGFIQELMAVECSMPKDLEGENWFKEELKKISIPQTKTEAHVPIPGMTMQSRLEGCDALEPFLTKSREIEIRKTDALATQQELESKRREKRMDEMKDYEDPVNRSPAIKIITDPS